MRFRKYLSFFLVLLIISLHLIPVPVPVLAGERVAQNNVPELQGTAAILIDGESGRVLYAKNAHQQLPQASLTKIMTALLVLEEGDLDQEVHVSKQAAETGESSIWLETGEVLTRRNLLYALMMNSANDAAAALAESVAATREAFIKKMNARAQQLGLKNTHFCNPHGLDAPGHYTSAYDLGMLTRKGMANPLFQKIVATEEIVIPWPGKPWDRFLYNKNRLLRHYQGATGVKTGYTEKAGYCLAGAARRGSLNLIAVVLNSPQVYEDTEELLDFGFAHYQGVLLGVPNKSLSVNVSKGCSKFVRLEPEHKLMVAVEPGERKRLSYRVIVEEGLRAPVEKGARLGAVQVLLRDREIGRIDLTAASSVGSKPSFWASIVGQVKLIFQKIFG